MQPARRGGGPGHRRRGHQGQGSLRWRAIPRCCKHEDENDFAVTFPDLPGCVAVGPNAEDALRLAEEALTFHLEGLAEEGIAAPMPRALGGLLNGNADRPDNAVLLLLTGRPAQGARGARQHHARQEPAGRDRRSRRRGPARPVPASSPKPPGG
ncbi:MAG: type II toxin-antitoxin system HicB family antitoxin [Pseudomonadota bacterium]